MTFCFQGKKNLEKMQSGRMWNFLFQNGIPKTKPSVLEENEILVAPRGSSSRFYIRSFSLERVAFRNQIRLNSSSL
ncbi:hypothetical protein DLM75_10390 [Leptospira stimsonii]|uniref:Uncharacterized protein n=1 Tax=Leptospira stimsonii TaxID=2202203 RepID=A0A396Z5L3_9LEPT|nr:hypothetical protein DLM75_10390 [Leptospira stimsonii]